MTNSPKKGEEEKKNEDVELVKLHHLKNCVIQLDVKASPYLLKLAKKKAIKEVAKEVEIPGFRKGKAPESLIEKKFSAQVEEQWHREIARSVFIHIQKKMQLPPLSFHSQINFNLKKHSPEEGAEITYTFETEPSIEKIDPKKFKLKEISKHPVGEKEVNEALRQLSFFHAKWKEITDRPVKEGDYLILDLEAIDCDPPEKVFTQTRFEVSEKGMSEWMRDLVIGAKVGDILEGISKPDKDLSEEEKKLFKAQKVKLTIKKIEEAELPEINDEFAKKQGSENVEKMKESIEKLLKNLAEEKEEEEKRIQVNNFFLLTDFDLPLSLIESEKKHRFEQLMKKSDFKKDWEKASKEEKEKIEKSIEKNASNSIRLFYITRKVVEDAKIAITQEEITKVVFAMNPQYGMDKTKITKDDEAIALSRLFLVKAQDYILENVTKKLDSSDRKNL